MGRASQLSTGRDACFTVRDKNGQALAYVSPIPSLVAAACSE